jgi:hypothetical protein
LEAEYTFHGSDPDIDLEWKIPELLMDAICYAFASLSDEELKDKLLSASYFDNTRDLDLRGYPRITYETEMSKDTVDRVAVNLFRYEFSKKVCVAVNIKFRNCDLFMINFKICDLTFYDAKNEYQSFADRFVIFFLLLGIPVGKSLLYEKSDRVPLSIDSLSEYIEIIMKEIESDCESGRINQRICTDVLAAFIDIIGMNKFIELCHENNSLELLMIGMRLQNGRDKSEQQLYID